MKRVACICVNWRTNGESSAAGVWTEIINSYCKEAGWSAELIAFSVSGRSWKQVRRDYDLTILPTNRPQFSADYLNKFDAAIMWSVGTFEDDKLDGAEPGWFTVCKLLQVPTIAWIASVRWLVEPDGKPGPCIWGVPFIRLPCVVAVGFQGEAQRDVAYKMVKDETFRSKPSVLLLHTVPHIPNEFVPTPERFCGRRLVLSTTRLGTMKNHKYLFEALRQIDLDALNLDLEVWGDFDGRNEFLLREKYNKELTDNWIGGYDRKTVPYIYQDAAFAIDLTRIINKTFILQALTVEVMANNTIPIVAEGWNLSPGMVPIPYPEGRLRSAKDAGKVVAETLKWVAAQSVDWCVEQQRLNWEYLQIHRSPVLLGMELVDFLENKAPALMGSNMAGVK